MLESCAASKSYQKSVQAGASEVPSDTALESAHKFSLGWHNCYNLTMHLLLELQVECHKPQRGVEGQSGGIYTSLNEHQIQPMAP